MIKNNPSDKLEETAVTVTIGNKPEEVTFSVNEAFNSFNELDQRLSSMKGKGGSMDEGFENDQSCQETN